MPEFESARFAAKSDYENFQQLFVSSRNEADTYKAADIWFALEALEGSPLQIFSDYLESEDKSILKNILFATILKITKDAITTARFKMLLYFE